MLAAEFQGLPDTIVEVLTLTVNIGGAGGFHRGLQRALEHGHDWIWLLDDDAIVANDALTTLLKAYDRFPENNRPFLLACKIVGIDGTLDAGTRPWLKRDDIEAACLAAEHRTVSLRVNAFVAVLIHRSIVQRYGLPIANYFIWLDDVEYTARILRREFGVLVPQSIVVHKRAVSSTDPGPRAYYGIRNQLWMICHSSAWSGEERLRLLGATFRMIARCLTQQPFKWERVAVAARGVFDGLLRSPGASSE